MIPIFKKKWGKVERVEQIPYLSGQFKMQEETEFWFETLLNKVMSVILVESNNKDFNITDYKSQLILEGMSFVTENYKRVSAYSCSPAKVAWYSPTTYTQISYRAPKIAETVSTKKGVLVRNTELYMPLNRLIAHYAVLLAHADITLQKSLVNVRRETGGLVATSDKEMENINRYLTDTFNGSETPILAYPFRDNVSLSEHASTSPRDCYEVRDCIVNAFLTEIGVKTSKVKKGNMQTAEVEADLPKILISVSDMIRCWNEGGKQIKEMFGFDVIASINPDIDANTYSTDFPNVGKKESEAVNVN